MSQSNTLTETEKKYISDKYMFVQKRYKKLFTIVSYMFLGLTLFIGALMIYAKASLSEIAIGLPLILVAYLFIGSLSWLTSGWNVSGDITTLEKHQAQGKLRIQMYRGSTVVKVGDTKMVFGLYNEVFLGHAYPFLRKYNKQSCELGYVRINNKFNVPLAFKFDDKTIKVTD